MMKKFLIAASLVALTACADDEQGVDGAVTPGSPQSSTMGAVTPGSTDQTGMMGSTDQAGMMGSNNISGDPGLNSLEPGLGTPSAGTALGNNVPGTVASTPNGQAKIEGEGQSQNVRYVKTYSLYVRSGPGMSHKPIGHLKFNQPIQILKIEPQGRWAKIGNGQYVGTRYLSQVPNKVVTIPSKLAH